MYGLLLESLACSIKENYGDEKWEEIRRASGVEQISFCTHQVYPENLIPRLSAKAIEVLSLCESKNFQSIFITALSCCAHLYYFHHCKFDC